MYKTRPKPQIRKNQTLPQYTAHHKYLNRSDENIHKLALVSVVHDGLHVVARKQSGDAVAHALEPAVVIFLDDVDDGTFHEGQLVILVLGVVVDSHH